MGVSRVQGEDWGDGQELVGLEKLSEPETPPGYSRPTKPLNHSPDPANHAVLVEFTSPQKLIEISQGGGRGRGLGGGAASEGG